MARDRVAEIRFQTFSVKRPFGYVYSHFSNSALKLEYSLTVVEYLPYIFLR